MGQQMIRLEERQSAKASSEAAQRTKSMAWRRDENLLPSVLISYIPNLELINTHGA